MITPFLQSNKVRKGRFNHGLSALLILSCALSSRTERLRYDELHTANSKLCGRHDEHEAPHTYRGSASLSDRL